MREKKRKMTELRDAHNNLIDFLSDSLDIYGNFVFDSKTPEDLRRFKV